MNEQSATRPLRALALLCLVAATTWVLHGWTRSSRHPVQATFDDLLTAAAAWALLAGLGWALLVCAAALVETLTSSRLAVTAQISPPGIRKVLLPVLGLALATGATTPALAAGPHGAADDGPPAGSLPVPARPSDERLPAAVVSPGDTLWGLAQERLRPSAPDAEVARLVARTHRLNRSVVGPDPDLIRPGQRLSLPALPAGQQPVAHHEEKQ